MPHFHRQIFIASTGTDIGKTYVTACLLRQLHHHKIQADAIKPIISGFSEATMAQSDSALLLQAQSNEEEYEATLDAIAQISPWRYAAPLSPNMAAAQEGQRIALPDVLDFCRRYASQKGDITFIESAGGIMVPLNEEATMMDWLVEMAIPSLLIIGSYLGTLSHCLTALAALDGRGVPPVAIILNESPHSAAPLTELTETLAHFTPIPIFSLARHATILPNGLIERLRHKM